jgi:DNA adenine methylase Dam
MEKIIYKSPLNYTGAKDKLMPELLKHFPKDVDTFYDVFAGGLSVTVNCDYKKIVSNDIIKPMIGFYREIQNSTDMDDFLGTIISSAISKKDQHQYNAVREAFNKEQSPYLFFALVSSCTNNMLRFNKKLKFNQTFGKRTINDSTIKKLTDYYRIINEKDITFTSMAYQTFFSHYFPTYMDFVYLDPPYMITEAGYNAYWSKWDEAMLYSILEMLDANGVRFVMSNVREHNGVINPHLDKLKNYKIIDLEYDYEKVAKKKGKGTQEIIVRNF